jgi:hypothetical protein
MKDWLVEIVDQIAVGEFLAQSRVTCGSRFGLIAVDNAVEFMLIAYVETYKQLIGGHKPGGIPKKDWDETKSRFPKLLSFVATCEPNIQPIETEISRYHDFRNNLYHSGLPLTTPPERVLKYSKLAKDVIAILFGINFSSDEWGQILDRISSSLTKSSTIATIKRQVIYEETNGVVKFDVEAHLSALDAIAICLHGYSVMTGAAPSRPLLVKSLAMSGHSLANDVINSRLSELRKSGWIQKDSLILSAKGRKELAKKYIF